MMKTIIVLMMIMLISISALELRDPIVKQSCPPSASAFAIFLGFLWSNIAAVYIEHSHPNATVSQQ